MCVEIYERESDNLLENEMKKTGKELSELKLNIKEWQKNRERLPDWWTELERKTAIIKQVSYNNGVTEIVAKVGNRGEENIRFDWDCSEFKPWQKVSYITFKKKRPTTKEEKEFYEKAFSEKRNMITDFISVMVPQWADVRKYFLKELNADKKRREQLWLATKEI